MAVQKKIAVFAVAMAAALFSGIAFAHEDRFPTVWIDAPKVVETSATIRVLAEDEDFRAGVSYIELYEDGRLTERKECAGKLNCKLERDFVHVEEGMHSYKALVADVTGNKVWATRAVKFEGADRPPIIATITRASVDEGSELAIDVKASDPNGDPVTLTARGMPAGARFENGRFIWTPTFSQSGSYVVTFEAITATKKTAKTIKINVRNKNREFEIKSETPSTGGVVRLDEGESKTFFVNTFDPDGDALSYRWVLDGRVVSYSRTYVYRPNFNDAGPHILSVTIKEGSYFLEKASGATKERSWKIEVRDRNRAPALSEHRKHVVEEGQRVWFVVKFDDPDKDPVTLEALDLPEGAEFDPRTGVFRWDTVIGDHGKYQPRFRVTDSKGSTDSKGVQIEVKKKPRVRIVHEDLHRIGKIPTSSKISRDSYFAWGGYGLIG